MLLFLEMLLKETEITTSFIIDPFPGAFATSRTPTNSTKFNARDTNGGDSHFCWD